MITHWVHYTYHTCLQTWPALWSKLRTNRPSFVSTSTSNGCYFYHASKICWLSRTNTS